MKTNGWLVLGTILATSALAQDNTNTMTGGTAPAAAPAMSAPAPVAPEAAVPVKKKKTARKKSPAAQPERLIHETPVSLVPGAAVVNVNAVNVRGQASFRGEVVAHLKMGDTVAVLEQINLQRHKSDEPGQWAKIALPAGAKVWVNAKYVDPATKTVTSKKLNLRAGPGENYSVVGLVERGATVNPVTTRGDWMEIESPQGAYAFVAAMYLKQEAMASAAATAPTPMPPPAPTPVVEAPSAAATAATEVPAPMAEQTPPPPRIVSHEGVVRHVGSVIAPTEFELYDPATQNNINYLYTTSTNLNLGRYDNMRIIVTGEEGLDERWKDTPIINVERIQVIATNAVKLHIYSSPRQMH